MSFGFRNFTGIYWIYTTTNSYEFKRIIFKHKLHWYFLQELQEFIELFPQWIFELYLNTNYTDIFLQELQELIEIANDTESSTMWTDLTGIGERVSSEYAPKYGIVK